MRLVPPATRRVRIATAHEIDLVPAGRIAEVMIG
jgi:hypothetical protein